MSSDNDLIKKEKSSFMKKFISSIFNIKDENDLIDIIEKPLTMRS